jgi:uncharacterized membrane protein YfcA
MELLASLWAEFQRDPATILLVCVITALSYSAQALTGFGGAVLGMPVLSAFKRLPVASAVPVFSLLDVVGGAINLWKFFGRADKAQIALLSLPMIVGTGAGVWLLEIVPNRWMLGLLGVFVLAVTSVNFVGLETGLLRNLSTGSGTIAGLCAGLFGGLFAGMFGTGGPIYALYISNRLDEPSVASTIGSFLAISAFVRATILLLRGLYADPQIIAIALAALPFVVASMLITHEYGKRISAKTVANCLRWILLTVGVLLILRAFEIL